MSTSTEPLRARLAPVTLIVGVLAGVSAWGGGADPRVAVGIAAGVVITYLTTGEWVVGTFTRDPAKLAARHTWSPEAHKAAVAYALHLDRDMHDDEARALGVAPDEAARLIGLDPDDEGGR